MGGAATGWMPLLRATPIKTPLVPPHRSGIGRHRLE
jgi:hypothetical protein